MSENWPAGRMKCRKMSFLWNSGFPQFNCPPGTKHEILDILRGNIDFSIFVWYFDVIRRYSMILKSSTYRGKIIRIPLPPRPAWELTIEFPLPSPRGCQKNNNRAGVILTCTYSTFDSHTQFFGDSAHLCTQNPRTKMVWRAPALQKKNTIRRTLGVRKACEISGPSLTPPYLASKFALAGEPWNTLEGLRSPDLP